MICDMCCNQTNTNFSESRYEILCYSCSVEKRKKCAEDREDLTPEKKAEVEKEQESEKGILFSGSFHRNGQSEESKKGNSGALGFVIIFVAFSFLLYMFYNPLIGWAGSEEVAHGLLLLTAAYFLPYIFALLRGHLSAGAILLTVLLLGWTGIGWVAALIWSFTGNTYKNKNRS